MEFAWDEARGAFEVAAQWFVATVAQVEDRWQQPGLGEWDVRALVGHTSRALLTVESYLAMPADRVDVAWAPLYYAATRSMVAGPAVTQRGRDAGRALGADPAAAVGEIADRVVALVQGCAGQELVTTIAGGMRLSEYLPTRTFELVVHTCDLAVALDRPVAPPAAAGRHALRLASELVLEGGHAGDVLLALAGRRSLPADFSVV